MNLKDKTVLVTGSSVGIGRATAIAFAKEGSKVFVHYNKNEQEANKTLEEVKSFSTGWAYQCDLQDQTKVSELFDQIVKDHGNIDILVNNAGDAQSSDLDDKSMWDYQYNNILMSAVYCTDEFLKHTSGHRKILNTTSIYGQHDKTSTGMPQYSAMKAALTNLTINQAKKLVDQSIQVNGVAPGATETPHWDTVPEQFIDEITSSKSIKRFITPEEIADTFVFLAKNDAINGQIIEVNGGMFMQ